VYSFPVNATIPPIQRATDSMMNLKTGGIKSISRRTGDIPNISIIIKGKDKTNVMINIYLSIL